MFYKSAFALRTLLADHKLIAGDNICIQINHFYTSYLPPKPVTTDGLILCECAVAVQVGKRDDR